MTPDWLSRTTLLIGPESVQKLGASHVLVVGLGGVGSFAAEFICRAGVGKMTIVDGDVVDSTNRNRQLPALSSTLRQPKTDVMRARLLDINPELELNALQTFMKEEECDRILDSDHFDYVVDAIDTVAPKLKLILKCVARGIPIVSSMGAGGKTDPNQVRIDDISKAQHCNLARYVRKRLRREGMRGKLPVVYSSEPVPEEALELTENTQNKRSYYGTISYMPALFGAFASSVVIRDLIGTFNPPAARKRGAQ